MRRSWVHSVVCAWTTYAVVFGGCRTTPQVVQKPTVSPVAAPVPPPPAPPSERPSVPIENVEDGKLTARLGETSAAASNATVTDLSPAETQALLARLEPLPAIDNSKAPIVRPPSAPPPRAGVTESIAFIAQTGKVIADKPVANDAPRGAPPPALSPPQILPVGEVSTESVIRVRFTEPMVAVSSVGEARTPPATITPAVTGSWRWIDTRVATFTAAGKRLAQATEYTLTVPAGIKAVSGATLVTPVEGKFTTPAVQIKGTFPTTTLRPDSPLVVYFDQDVDPTAIVKYLRVEDPKKRKLPFTAITLEAAKKLWARNPSISITKDDLTGSFVVLAPRGGWTPGIEGQVVLGKKAPSREGPRISDEESGALFEVAPTFVTQGIICDRMEQPRHTGVACPANSYLSVRFTNPIDESTYRATKIQISGMAFYDHPIDTDSVTLETPLSVGTAHTIPIGDGIKDVFGQPLVGNRDLAFTTARVRHDPYLNARTGMFVLDPRYEIPQWVVSAQAISSLRIELYQVEPTDFFAFQQHEAGKSKTLPGKRVLMQDHPIGARHAATARVDLRPALSASGTGNLIAVATAKPAPGARKLEYNERGAYAWIQVSKLGISARIDGERLHAWTQDITPSAFLKPLSGVQTSLLVDGRTDAPAAVTTDASGHAAYELLPKIERKAIDQRYPTALLLAKHGSDTAFFAIGGNYERSIRTNDARWYVTDDRFTYKPNEPVYIKGWVRWTDDGVNPDLHLPNSGETVAYTLTDSKGNKITSGNAPLTKQGGFDIEMKLPANVNLGRASLDLSTRREHYSHPISIEEFRTPAFAVNLTDDVQFSASRPLILGESISMSTEAKYYAGGGLAGSAVSWQARLQAASYAPPGWDRYTFATIQPRSDRGYWWRGKRRYGSQTSTSESAQLSGASTSSIEFGIAALPDHSPSVLVVDSTVTDIDRQTIRATSREILVHPATLYVGARLKPGSHDVLQLIVTNLDGDPVSGVPIDVEISGVRGSERHRDDAEIVDKQSCKATSAAEPVTCAFKLTDIQYSYEAIARIKDSRGRDNLTQYDVPWYSRADRDLNIVPDKLTYKVGDVAKLVVSSTRQPAAAVVTFARNGVITQKRVDLTTPATVELPIEAAYIENIKVLVDRISKRSHQREAKNVPATKLPLPEHDYMELDLAVDVESARLSMRTRPLQPLVEPGADATFEVEVKHEDKPVKGAEVALIVVDEAVLAISGRDHADPLTPFYKKVDDGTWHASNVRLIEDAGHDLGGKPGFERWSLDGQGRFGSGTGSGYGSGSGRGGMRGRSAAAPTVSMGAVVKSRKDFRATAVFSPKLETDANGKVRVSVKMPDSLTRYRVVALATANTHNFGKAESNIVAQLKVNARTVAPRFLTQGDTFSLPVVVQNLDTAPRTIDVAVRAANLAATGVQGKRVVVPAGQRAELRFPFATQTRGTAVIQTIASAGKLSDATNVEVPVYEPATTESFATYGSLTDKPQYELLKIPADIFPEVGGVEAEVSSTQMQNITDAYWYLYAYPFECAEQRSGRMLATSALADILEAFATRNRPTKQEILEQRAFDVKKLTRDQKGDGGWGYFRDMDSDPFVTMQVLSALGAQDAKGDVVTKASGFVTKQGDTLLTALEKQVKARNVKLKNRSDDAANISLAAAAFTSLASVKTDVTKHAVRLHEAATRLGTYPVDAKARLLAIFAGRPAHKKVREKLTADLLSVVHETAAAATVTASYTEAEKLLLVSNNKTTALTLDALLREAPQHALITKLARGLLDARRRGRWMSTQENVVVLQALRRYFDVYEKETPNFTGKIWLGTTAYAEQLFAGRTTLRAVTQADWSMLKPGSTHDIALDKSGPGRMYYRLGITYAPKAVDLPPLDAGFIVRRTYKAVDHASDVVQQPDGRWKIKLGARVLVQLETINTSARHAVALVDPLPAGFEAVNTRLATSERAADGESDSWDHTAMRSNRAEVFEMQLAEGSHKFSYTARATTPGTFIAAPAKSEEMYSPETFGRSAGTTVVIE